ncbi:hypothetical protein JCM8208_000977 [Rhodotorula glutinis]
MPSPALQTSHISTTAPAQPPLRPAPLKAAQHHAQPTAPLLAAAVGQMDPSTEAEPCNLAIDSLKSSTTPAEPQPVPRLATPRKRVLASVPHKRFSTASALAESLTTPPPPYETATRASSPPPSPSARRSRTPRTRAPPAPASVAADADDSDPTSDSDDPLNHLLRLTGSLLSTSTSILASSTALHTSLSRLLSSDAVARPPHLADADSRAELELRSGVDAADRAGDRLSQLESATERWARRSGGAQAAASGGASVGGRTARGEGPLVGRQDRAERPRTLYATATGAGSGFLAGLDEGDAEDEGEDTSGSRVEQERSGPPPQGAQQPSRRSSSAAQDLLGRLAGREAAASEVEPSGPLDGGQPGYDEPPVEQAMGTMTSSGSRTSLYPLVEEQTAASSSSDDFRKSALVSPFAGDDPSPSSAPTRAAAPPRSPASRHRSAPFTPSSAGIASMAASPRPSPSSLFAPSPTRARDIRTSASLAPVLSPPSAAVDGLGIASPSTSSSPSTSPASSRPSHHHRTSTAAASAAAFATSLSQHRASTTTSLAHDLDGERDSLAAVVRAGAGAGSAGSARGALQALSANAGAAGAGGAAGVPGAQVGKVEGRAAARGPTDDGSAAQRVGASWWSWS